MNLKFFFNLSLIRSHLWFFFFSFLFPLGNSYDFDKFSVASRASVRANYIAVGTDGPDAKKHFLSVINGHTMLHNGREDPVVCYTPVSEHVSNTRWLNDSTLLTATGRGNLKLFHFDEGNGTIKHVGKY
jgi:hypothetical protein